MSRRFGTCWVGQRFTDSPMFASANDYPSCSWLLYAHTAFECSSRTTELAATNHSSSRLHICPSQAYVTFLSSHSSHCSAVHELPILLSSTPLTNTVGVTCVPITRFAFTICF